MAKFGQLFLQDGVWLGRRLLPEGWVAEASSFHIQQNPRAQRKSARKATGCRGTATRCGAVATHAFRADGAFGQYIVVMPDQDAVLAITSQTGNMQGVLDLVWEHLLPAMHDGALPANAAGIAALHRRIEKLALPVPAKNTSRKKGAKGSREVVQARCKRTTDEPESRSNSARTRLPCS